MIFHFESNSIKYNSVELLNSSKAILIWMDERANRFLLAGDIFMPEMPLKQPRFTYNACVPFTKTKERIEKFQEAGSRRFNIYRERNEMDKACFHHDIRYGDIKDLAWRRAPVKVLHDKALDVAKNPKYDGYQRGLASMVYNFFVKRSVKGCSSTFTNKFAY